MVALIAEIIDVQTLFGQQCLNVFHYVDPAGTGNPEQLVNDYIDDVLPLMRNIQAAALSHTAIRWRKVYPVDTLTQEHPISPPITGNSGDTSPLASCDALSFKWNLTDTTVLQGGFTGHIKRGGMRMAGPYENQVDGNDVVAGVLAPAALFTAELLNPGEGAFQLCVASFLSGNPVPHTPRTRHTTVQAYAIVHSASDPGVSTQNTRKFLRGRSS